MSATLDVAIRGVPHRAAPRGPPGPGEERQPRRRPRAPPRLARIPHDGPRHRRLGRRHRRDAVPPHRPDQGPRVGCALHRSERRPLGLQPEPALHHRPRAEVGLMPGRAALRPPTHNPHMLTSRCACDCDPVFGAARDVTFPLSPPLQEASGQACIADSARNSKIHWTSRRHLSHVHRRRARLRGNAKFLPSSLTLRSSNALMIIIMMMMTMMMIRLRRRMLMVMRRMLSRRRRRMAMMMMMTIKMMMKTGTRTRTRHHDDMLSPQHWTTCIIS